MQHTLYQEESHHKKDLIATIFIKNLIAVVQIVHTGINLLLVSILGFFFYLLDFKQVKAVWDIFLPRIVLYLLGVYLTVLPLYVVFFLVFLPVRFSFPIVIISSLASFFIIYSI